jgi:hypothetical protein
MYVETALDRSKVADNGSQQALSWSISREGHICKRSGVREDLSEIAGPKGISE